jgi:CRISPR-associated endonuclease/helicase Cas3
MANNSEHNSDHDVETGSPGVEKADAGGTAAADAVAKPTADLAEHGLRTGASESRKPSSATHSPDATVARFDTAAGRLSYHELAERLSRPLRRLDYGIRSGRFAEQPFDETLLLKLHADLTTELFPEQSGRYRQNQNEIRGHLPPAPHLVPQQMRDYTRNIAERIKNLSGEADELLLELMAYAEGELLSIHPFPDLNGRSTRSCVSRRTIRSSSRGQL